MPEKADAGVGRTASLRGIRMYFEVLGDGPPLLLLHGGAGDGRQFDRQRSDFARSHRDRGGNLAAVCTGAMWLADAGLVGGRPATTHHQFWDELAATGADVRRGERVVDDGDLVTSGGITSGLFLGLHLVERLVGAEARREVEVEIELPTVPGFAATASG